VCLHASISLVRLDMNIERKRVLQGRTQYFVGERGWVVPASKAEKEAVKEWEARQHSESASGSELEKLMRKRLRAKREMPAADVIVIGDDDDDVVVEKRSG
jgi:hypothetical protein